MNCGKTGRKRAARILVAWLFLISCVMPSFSFYEGSTLNVYGNTPQDEEGSAEKDDIDTSEDSGNEGASEEDKQTGSAEKIEWDYKSKWEIGTADELRDFATKVNNGDIAMPVNVKLTNDIIFDRPSDEEIKQAQEAYDKAKEAYDKAKEAYDKAKEACMQAKKAYDKAKKAYRQAREAYMQAEEAYDKAKKAYMQAQEAYMQAREAYMQAEEELASKSNWTSIGTNNHRFSGTFDGDNHIISGLCVLVSLDCKGLFGYCDDIEICNLTMENIFIRVMEGWEGVFIGRAYSSVTITGCSYNGDKCNGETDKKLLVGYAEDYEKVDVSFASSAMNFDSELDIGEVGMIGDIIEPETRNPKAIFIWGAALLLIVGAGGAFGYKIYKKRK